MYKRRRRAMAMTPDELCQIVMEFRKKHPGVEGLNATQMREVLAGRLVIVRHSGKRTFELMTPEDLRPGGKLDRHNRRVAALNRAARLARRESQALAQKRLQLILEGRYDEAFSDLLPDAVDFTRILGKAECHLGDIMYEMATQKVGGHEDHEAVMREVEMMSDEDLRFCRGEAIGEALDWKEPHDGFIDKVLGFWERRGF
jgi:hypothetical protein